jgi:hypothetical protein
MFIETNPSSEDMIVEVSQAGFRVAWTHELRRRLFELRPDDSTGLRPAGIYRQTDW